MTRLPWCAVFILSAATAAGGYFVGRWGSSPEIGGGPSTSNKVRFVHPEAKYESDMKADGTGPRQVFPHGREADGEYMYAYKDGRPKLKEIWRDGDIMRSEWYRPNGRLMAIAGWYEKTGLMFYVRDAGTAYAMVPLVLGVAQGEGCEYDENERAATIVTYQDGRAVSRRPAPKEEAEDEFSLLMP